MPGNIKYTILILSICLPGRGSQSAGCYVVEMTGMDAILAAIQTMYQVVPVQLRQKTNVITPCNPFHHEMHD